MDELKDINVCVVLPASGHGARMSLETPKQYIKILDKPLLLFSVKCFQRVGWIKQIVVAVDKRCVEFVAGLMEEEGFDNVTVVEGGSTRHRSIYAGIKQLNKVCHMSDVVLIHDAVRPLADLDVITQVSIAAKRYGSAGVSRPLVSTVIAVDETGFLSQSLDRNQYRASEMPQAFQYQLIKTAYEMSSDSDFEFGTECLQLVLAHTGTKAKMVEGPSSLWKVTYKKDLYAAEGILKELYLHVCVVGGTDDFYSKFQCYLKDHTFECSHTSDLSYLPPPATDVVLYYPLSTDTQIDDSLSRLPEAISHLAGDTKLISTPVIIFVYLCSNDIDLYHQYAALHKKLSDGLDIKAIPVAVLTKDTSDQSKLYDLLKSLLWDRRASMAGQVFIV